MIAIISMVSGIDRTYQAAYILADDCCCAHVNRSLVGTALCRQGAVACAIADQVVLLKEEPVLSKPSWTHQEHIIHFHLDMY
jgi:hypothetical protein